MDIFQISSGMVHIVDSVSKYAYTDSVANYEKDGGVLHYSSALYDTQQKIYEANGVPADEATKAAIVAEIRRCPKLLESFSERQADRLPFEEARTYKAEELNTEMRAYQRMPVHNFDAGDSSICRMVAAMYHLRESGGTMGWTMSDNSVLAVTADDLEHALAEIGKNNDVIHTKYIEAMAKLNQAKTKDDLKKIHVF